MSIVTFEKLESKISEPDWYDKLNKLRGACRKIRRSAFTLKYESRTLRNETGQTTYWGTHRTNTNIANR